MILTLRGLLTHKLADSIVLEVGGIGHEVRMPKRTLFELACGQEVAVWIHDHNREDSHDLFGFRNDAEFRLFRALLNVSGVGPKTALAALEVDVAEVGKRIDAGDAAWVATIPGVGKKTAQKIILELKGKLVDMKDGDEVLGALVSMGYRREEALLAAQQAKGETVEERLKHSLRALAR